MSTSKLSTTFEKDTPIFTILDFWRKMNSDEITRKKSGKKEKFVLIQLREFAVRYLFADLLAANDIPKDVVKKSLIKIAYLCISPSAKKKEKRGWAIRVAISVANAYNESYADNVDARMLAAAILDGGSRTDFKGEWDEEPAEEIEEEVSPEPQKVYEEFIPSGKPSPFTKQVMSIEELARKIAEGTE